MGSETPRRLSLRRKRNTNEKSDDCLTDDSKISTNKTPTIITRSIGRDTTRLTAPSTPVTKKLLSHSKDLNPFSSPDSPFPCSQLLGTQDCEVVWDCNSPGFSKDDLKKVQSKTGNMMSCKTPSPVVAIANPNRILFNKVKPKEQNNKSFGIVAELDSLLDKVNSEEMKQVMLNKDDLLSSKTISNTEVCGNKETSERIHCKFVTSKNDLSDMNDSSFSSENLDKSDTINKMKDCNLSVSDFDDSDDNFFDESLLKCTQQLEDALYNDKTGKYNSPSTIFRQKDKPGPDLLRQTEKSNCKQIDKLKREYNKVKTSTPEHILNTKGPKSNIEATILNTKGHKSNIEATILNTKGPKSNIEATILTTKGPKSNIEATILNTKGPKSYIEATSYLDTKHNINNSIIKPNNTLYIDTNKNNIDSLIQKKNVIENLDTFPKPLKSTRASFQLREQDLGTNSNKQTNKFPLKRNNIPLNNEQPVNLGSNLNNKPVKQPVNLGSNLNNKPVKQPVNLGSNLNNKPVKQPVNLGSNLNNKPVKQPVNLGSNLNNKPVKQPVNLESNLNNKPVKQPVNLGSNSNNKPVKSPLKRNISLDLSLSKRRNMNRPNTFTKNFSLDMVDSSRSTNVPNIQNINKDLFKNRNTCETLDEMNNIMRLKGPNNSVVCEDDMFSNEDDSTCLMSTQDFSSVFEKGFTEDDTDDELFASLVPLVEDELKNYTNLSQCFKNTTLTIQNFGPSSSNKLSKESIHCFKSNNTTFVKDKNRAEPNSSSRSINKQSKEINTKALDDTRNKFKSSNKEQSENLQEYCLLKENNSNNLRIGNKFNNATTNLRERIAPTINKRTSTLNDENTKLNATIDDDDFFNEDILEEITFMESQAQSEDSKVKMVHPQDSKVTKRIHPQDSIVTKIGHFENSKNQMEHPQNDDCNKRKMSTRNQINNFKFSRTNKIGSDQGISSTTTTSNLTADDETSRFNEFFSLEGSSDSSLMCNKSGLRLLKVGLSSSKVGVSSSKVGLSSSKVRVSSSKVGLSSSKVGVSSVNTGLSTSSTCLSSSNTGLRSSNKISSTVNQIQSAINEFDESYKIKSDMDNGSTINDGIKSSPQPLCTQEEIALKRERALKKRQAASVTFKR